MTLGGAAEHGADDDRREDEGDYDASDRNAGHAAHATGARRRTRRGRGCDRAVRQIGEQASEVVPGASLQRAP